MHQVPIHNDSANTRYVGGVAIQPGETKFIDRSLLPVASHQTPAAPAPQHTDDGISAALRAIADLSVSALKHAIEATGDDGQPEIADDDLLLLLRAEEEGKNRSTAIDAIHAEMLERAAEAADAEGEV